jgi:hypothetical protein
MPSFSQPSDSSAVKSQLDAQFSFLSGISKKMFDGAQKMLESHSPEAARAAEAVVKEAAQKASEETAKATQHRKESAEKLTVLIKQNNGRAAQGNVIKSTL